MPGEGIESEVVETAGTVSARSWKEAKSGLNPGLIPGSTGPSMPPLRCPELPTSLSYLDPAFAWYIPAVTE